MSDATEPEVLEYLSGGGTPLRIHLFVPAAEPPQAGVLLFHGGGWTSGTPEQLFPQCRALAMSGILAASAAYRFVDGATAGLHDCMADARLAFQRFGRAAGRRGIPPDLLSVGGASAGGHLAASIALMPDGTRRSDVPTAVRSLVLFNPVLDVNSLGVVRRESYGITAAQASTLSPSGALRPGAPPTLIVHGTADQTVHIGSIRTYRDRMRSNGDHCRLIEFAGADHGFFNFRPTGNDLYDQVTAEVIAFLAPHPRKPAPTDLGHR